MSERDDLARTINRVTYSGLSVAEEAADVILDRWCLRPICDHTWGPAHRMTNLSDWEHRGCAHGCTETRLVGLPWPSEV